MNTQVVPEFSTALPKRAGISLKPEHVDEILETRPSISFFEIHAENYMAPGGPPHQWMTQLRELYPLSVHGVGLSLGGDEPLDEDHLDALADVVNRYEPQQVSEHLAWCKIDGTYLNDLLPLPYTPHSLQVVCDHVDQVQERLKRPILMENPAATLSFEDSTITEVDFMTEMVKRTGCGILFDVNNLYVSAHNIGIDIQNYLDTIPGHAIGEIHLAGHHVRKRGNIEIRIDDHGSTVDPEVWELYAETIARFGRIPSLVEWDTDVPTLEILLGQAHIADDIAKQAASNEAEVSHAIAS